MKFHPTKLAGLFLIELEPRGDARGFLARTYCEREFTAAGLNTRWPQSNLTLTRQQGAVRGMHWQAEPEPEIKLIRCAAGAIFDCLVDMRPESPTFGQWEGFELTARNARQLYVPGGFAHGFQCLSPECEVFYQMSAEYVPDLARGLRHDDPRVDIRWPLPVAQVSARDAGLPLLAKIFPGMAR